MEPKLEKKKKKTFLIPVIIAITVAVIAIVVIVIVANANSKVRRVEKLMDTAEKYVSELDYKQAVATYKEIIEIDPTNVQAYINLAELYVLMEKLDKAIKVLEEGYEQTHDDEIHDLLEEYEALHDEEESGSGSASGTGEVDGGDGPIVLALDDQESIDYWFEEASALWCAYCSVFKFVYQPGIYGKLYYGQEKADEIIATGLEYVEYGYNENIKNDMLYQIYNICLTHYTVYADTFITVRDMLYERTGEEMYNPAGCMEFTVVTELLYGVEEMSSQMVGITYDDKGYIKEYFLHVTNMDREDMEYTFYFEDTLITSCVYMDKRNTMHKVDFDYDSNGYMIHMKDYNETESFISNELTYQHDVDGRSVKTELETVWFDEYGRKVQGKSANDYVANWVYTYYPDKGWDFSYAQ